MNNIHHDKEGSTPWEGVPAHPQPKPRLSEGEQAEATHYAYDPQTYEVLCRPGQRLSEKKIKRLQELNLYRYIVKITESPSP